MKKLVKFVAFAAVASVAMGAVESAKAAQVSIIDYIDSSGAGDTDGIGVGEQRVTSDLQFNNSTISGLPFDFTMSAYGTLSGDLSDVVPSYPNPPSSTATYAYLDGGNAGMGVCSGGTTGTQCTQGDDDNVGIGKDSNNDGSGDPVVEILSISFNGYTEFDITDFYFRNEGHKPDFYDDSKGESVATTPQKLFVSTDGVSWDPYTLENENDNSELGATLIGFPPIENWTAGSVIHFKNDPDTDPRTQFYLAGFDIEPSQGATPVPLPAGLLLLLSGLFGLGFLGRFKAKSV